ncbi:MAG TPA: pyridoxal-phosphate dependent enzyme [Candidatus Dormibacteraeota bacterium]|nr:pyridoxal-phosphate dependent enzyme [Candidatus Dormibacteraeota bacterium]
MISLEQIRTAVGRAGPFVARTPLLPIDDGVWLKLELLQPTGSFKVRGFFAAALALPEERRRRGLLTVSAGNAALACAHVARRLGVPCRVVMPDRAPAPKVEGVRRLGGIPLLVPRAELLAWLADRRWEGEPEAFIHPFADPAVQAGHAGIGLEILEQLPQVERVVVAVGGGGLVSGIGAALAHLRPSAEVVGVQSDGYPLWPRTFAEGRPPTLVPNTIADGTTAPYDAVMRERLAACVDRWVTVPESRLRNAVGGLVARARVVAEGAGALPVAALEQLAPGPTTVAVISGGNIDPALLARLLAEMAPAPGRAP